ncbi:MAG: efflux RND transporter periplasmic adaptor subunit [Verrucomicrobia bacterium]|nr:efflux RND transporter periplasmic adaptor subunit [Verrucomicrobiota bacterium]
MTLTFVNRSHPRNSGGTVAIALALACLSGCGERPQTSAGGGGGRGGRGGGGPAPVIVSQAQRKVVPLVIDAIGAVESIHTAAIRSQITGTMMKIAIDEGQDVKQGDLLFEIDPRPFRNALQSAEADRQKILVQLENARAQVARYRTLSADAMVSKEQFQKIQDDARALEAQSLASESTVANTRLQLDYCSIRAPFAGRTGNLGGHVGDLVRANEAGVALVTINQLNPIYVTFGVPQQNLTAVNRYRAKGTLEVNVIPPGPDETPEKGELTFVDNVVDSSTGTIKLKATFANASHRLWPGQFAVVAVTLSSPEVLTIPSSAVQPSQSGQHVFVVKADQTAELRTVTVERTHGNDAVITNGLAEGETVVIDGQLRVVPGRPVEIKQSGAPAGGGSRGGEGGKGRGKGKKAT